MTDLTTAPLDEIPLRTLGGDPTSLADYAGRAVLVVNVASHCGFTKQYTGLQELATRYADRGLTVVGVPCNQFGGQEPGTAEEIAQFCSTTYSVTFPLLEKTDVNGPDRHPLFAELTRQADDAGNAGDVSWNFEKFLLGPDHTVRRRFRSKVEPSDPALVAAVEDVLPS
jgi:glutathione peroxidase